MQNSKLCAWCDYSTTCGIFHKYVKNPIQFGCDDSKNMSNAFQNDNEKEKYNKSLFSYETSAEMNQFLTEKAAHLNNEDLIYFKCWSDKIFADWSKAKDLSPNFLLFSDTPELRLILMINNFKFLLIVIICYLIF